MSVIDFRCGVDEVLTEDTVDACCGLEHEAEITWLGGLGTYECPTAGLTHLYA